MLYLRGKCTFYYPVLKNSSRACPWTPLVAMDLRPTVGPHTPPFQILDMPLVCLDHRNQYDMPAG